MLNNSGLITLTIRRSFMYGTPRAYKKAANDQECERRGMSAVATVFEKINHCPSFRYVTAVFGPFLLRCWLQSDLWRITNVKPRKRLNATARKSLIDWCQAALWLRRKLRVWTFAPSNTRHCSSSPQHYLLEVKYNKYNNPRALVYCQALSLFCFFVWILGEVFLFIIRNVNKSQRPVRLRPINRTSHFVPSTCASLPQHLETADQTVLAVPPTSSPSTSCSTSAINARCNICAEKVSSGFKPNALWYHSMAVAKEEFESNAMQWFV